MTRLEKTASMGAVLRTYGATALKYPGWVFLMLLAVVGMQATNLAVPFYLRNLINTLSQSSPAPETVATLLSILTVLAAWLVARWVAGRLEHYFNLRIIVNGMADLVSQAFERLMGHSYNFFISNFAGSLTHKVHKFGRSFQVIYESTVLTFFPTLLFVAGAVVILSLRHPLLGAGLGLWAFLFFIFQVWATRARQPLRLERATSETRLTAALADAISNHSTATLFAGSAHEKKLFGESVERWRLAGLRAWNADLMVWGGMGVLMFCVEVGLLWAGIVLWGEGVVTVGDFLLIQAYLLILFERLNNIQNELKRVFDAFADGGEMLGIMQTVREVADVPGARPLVVGEGRVSFERIDFSFGSEPVLKNFTLEVNGGEKVSLVGPSGAGKSTLTRLLLRLFNIKEGAIRIDGQDIAQVEQESLRRAIAFVPQEPILFHRTLMENIRYGRQGASDEEVYEAARKAHCHEFISQLPKGYDTYVGERGVKLSGGERQRVAIARAILKDAPLLVLDEATSSLDSESEALIQDALETLMQGKTVLVIAHRLSTIMKMDRIIVMEKGAIVAEGSHDELLKQDGLYKKLWSIQAGGFLLNDGSDKDPDLALEDPFDAELADTSEEK